MRIAIGCLLLSSCLPLSAQLQDQSHKPRVYISDSHSWETSGGFGGTSDAAGGASSGGARPQTAEIIKTFGERCPQVTPNNIREKAGPDGEETKAFIKKAKVRGLLNLGNLDSCGAMGNQMLEGILRHRDQAGLERGGGGAQQTRKHLRRQRAAAFRLRDGGGQAPSVRSALWLGAQLQDRSGAAQGGA